MGSTITLSAPFDMSAINFEDLQDGTDTFVSSTEVDITAVGGHKFVFYGSGFSDIYRGLPLNGQVSSFTIDGILTATESGENPVYLEGFGWRATGLADGTVNGSSGDDTLISFENTAYGNGGDDVLQAIYAESILVGGAGNDTYQGFTEGGYAADTTVSYADATSGIRVSLLVAGGQDVGAGLGFDTLTDITNLTGSAFNDRLTGNDLPNILDGGGGHDTLIGGAGNDTIIAYDAADTISGGAGSDTVTYFLSAPLVLDMANIKSVETVIGSSFGDTIVASDHKVTLEGQDGNDTLTGSPAADTLVGGTGNDVMDGGAGRDVATYAGSHNGVTVDLSIAGPQFVSNYSGTDTLISISSLIGSSHDDTVTGDDSSNILVGGAGNDTLSGGKGNDVIEGGNGADTLTGGAGADTFLYEHHCADSLGVVSGSEISTVTAMDTITDYVSGRDHFQFADNGHALLPSVVDLASGTVNAASLESDLDAVLSGVGAFGAVLITASSGDLAGHSYLVVNYGNIHPAFSANDIVIAFGAGSHLTGFGASDFI